MSKKNVVVTPPEMYSYHVTPSSINVFESFTTKPPELDFAFCALLAGSVGALVSPGGHGKSMLALCIAIAVSTGHDFTGGALEVQKTGKVTYLSAEDGGDILANRMYSIGRFLPPDVFRAAADTLHIKSLKGVAGRWLLDEYGKEHRGAIDCLWRESDGQRLVVMDTIRRFHLADENNSGQMSHLLSILENLAMKTGCTYLFLHHANKYAATNGYGDQQAASRGSSVLVDNARYQANLVGMTVKEAHQHRIPKEDIGKYARFVSTKVNYKEKGGDVWLYRNEGGVLTRANFGRKDGAPLPLPRTMPSDEPAPELTETMEEGGYEVENFSW